MWRNCQTESWRRAVKPAGMISTVTLLGSLSVDFPMISPKVTSCAFSHSTAKSSTLIWSGTKRLANRKDSASFATKTKDQQFWPLIISMALRYINIYNDKSAFNASTQIGFFARFKLGNFQLYCIHSRVCWFKCIISLIVSQQLLGKSLRVDHVADYKVPKDHEDLDETTRRLRDEGCAPVAQIPPALIKREESRRPVKRERSPVSPADVRKVKRERSSSSRERKVGSLSFIRATSYHTTR